MARAGSSGLASSLVAFKCQSPFDSSGLERNGQQNTKQNSSADFSALFWDPKPLKKGSGNHDKKPCVFQGSQTSFGASFCIYFLVKNTWGEMPWVCIFFPGEKPSFPALKRLQDGKEHVINQGPQTNTFQDSFGPRFELENELKNE